MGEQQKEAGQHHSIQLRAYRLWEERGRPLGTPEIDWFKAEQELWAENHDILQEPLTAMAKVVGSVLGSVAGVVTTITNSLGSE